MFNCVPVQRYLTLPLVHSQGNEVIISARQDILDGRAKVFTFSSPDPVDPLLLNDPNNLLEEDWKPAVSDAAQRVFRSFATFSGHESVFGGSGFVIKEDVGVTAKHNHVLFHDWDNPVPSGLTLGYDNFVTPDSVTTTWEVDRLNLEKERLGCPPVCVPISNTPWVPGADVSLIKLSLKKAVPPLRIASKPLDEGAPVAVIGYPALPSVTQWDGEKHRSKNLDWPVVQSLFGGGSRKVLSVGKQGPSITDGLSCYTADTLHGMSGGMVFNKDAELVGIHVGGRNEDSPYNLYLPVHHPAFDFLLSSVYPKE